MATLQDRPFSRDYSGLTNQSALAIAIITICVTSFEIMKRRRRGRRRDEPLGTVESWQFGYLYQGRSWAKNPSPPHPRGWPLAWVKEVVMFSESQLHQLRGVDASVYCRFIRGCFWFTLLHTFTTTAILLPIHVAFSTDLYSSRSMNRALISSLVATSKGPSLLWIHLCLLLWVTVSWILTLLWICRGTFRYRRKEAEYALRLAEREVAEKSGVYCPHPHPQHPFHDMPLTHDESNKGTRLRTVMVSNVPTRLRSEKELKEYFEYYMSRPILKPSMGLTSSTQPGMINKLATMFLNRMRRTKLFAADKEAQERDSVDVVKEMEGMADRGRTPVIQRVIIARKMTELASLLDRREDVLNKLETAHIKLARRALDAVKEEMDRREFGPSRQVRLTDRMKTLSGRFTRGGGDESARSSGDAALNPGTGRSEEGGEDEEEAESRMDLLLRTLGPYVEEFGMRNQRSFLTRRIDDVRFCFSKAIAVSRLGPPRASETHFKFTFDNKQDASLPNNILSSPRPTIWDALFSLPRPTLDAYQPLIHLSALFRGRTVPAIDYYTTKTKLLTSLIAESRGRMLNDFEPVSTAFVTFARPEDARRACKYLAVHPKNPLACFVTMAPDYEDLDWVRVMKSTFRAEIVKDWVIDIGVWVFTIAWVIPVSLLVALVNIKNIAVVIPGLLNFLNRHAYLLEVISSLLPTLFTSLLMLLIPPILLLIAKKAHTINTLSALHDKIMTRYHKFLIANIFVFFCVGVSTLESFFTSLKSSINVLTVVGESFPTAGPFYVGWFIFTTSIHAGTELLLFGLPLFVYPSTKHQITPRKRAIGIRPRTFNYYYWLPNHVLIVTLTLVFAVLNPLLTPFAFLYFCFETVVIRNQLLHVYAKIYEGNGHTILIRLVRYTLDGMILAQVCFMGFCGLNKKEIHVALTAVIIAFTVIAKLTLTRVCRAKFEAIEVQEARIICGDLDPESIASSPTAPNHGFLERKDVKAEYNSTELVTVVGGQHAGSPEMDKLVVPSPQYDQHDSSSPHFRPWRLPRGMRPNLEHGFQCDTNPDWAKAVKANGEKSREAHKPIPSGFANPKVGSENRNTSWDGKDDGRVYDAKETKNDTGRKRVIGSMPDLRDSPGHTFTSPTYPPSPLRQTEPSLSRPHSPPNNHHPLNRPLLVTPHPPHPPWDDTSRLDRTYDNPYYSRPVANWMWLPRDPVMLGTKGGNGKGGWLDLDDTVRVWRAITSDVGIGRGAGGGGRLGEVVGGGAGEGMGLDDDFEGLELGVGMDGAILVDEGDIPSPIATTPSGSEEDLNENVRNIDPDRLSVGTPPGPVHPLQLSPRLAAIASSGVITSEPEPLPRSSSFVRLTGNEEIAMRPMIARRISNLSKKDDVEVASEHRNERTRSSLSLPTTVSRAVEAFKGAKRPSTANSRVSSHNTRPGPVPVQSHTPTMTDSNGTGTLSIGLGRPSTFNAPGTDVGARQISLTSMSASSAYTQRRSASLFSQFDDPYGRDRTMTSRRGRGRSTTVFADPAAMPDLHAQARFVRSRVSLLSDGGRNTIVGANANAHLTPSSLSVPPLVPLAQTYSRSTTGSVGRIYDANRSHSRTRTHRPRAGSTTTRASNLISTREAVVGEVIAEEVQATEERLRKEEKEAGASELITSDGETGGEKTGTGNGRSWLTSWMFRRTTGGHEREERSPISEG